MLAGCLAGITAMLFALAFGEPQLELAIGFESLTAHHAEPELISRTVQRGIGLLTACVATGIALGGILALVFAAMHRRTGPADPRVLTAWLAAAGFLAVVLVPQLKYPANPPSIGEAATIGLRTALY